MGEADFKTLHGEGPHPRSAGT